MKTLLTLMSFLQNEDPQWHEDYEDALREARGTGKPILVRYFLPD